jgi:hypothetical protein
MPVALNHNKAATVTEVAHDRGQFTDAAGNFSDRVFEFDPATRQWRERTNADGPWRRRSGGSRLSDLRR